jgi:itaconate CoA-transferase
MSFYNSEYKSKVMSAENAIEHVYTGNTIIHGVNFSEPPALLRALADRARTGDIKDLKTYSFNPMKHAAETIFAPDLVDVIETHSWFVSGSVRNLVKVGLTYYVPSFFYQVPRLIRDFMDVDVVITAVCPMDKAGYFSFGAASYIVDACRAAKRVIVEVNENMPRVFGDCMIHISEVDAIVENHVPLMESIIPPLKPEDEIVGKYIAELIPNGASIQLGIGGLPNAAAVSLRNHKDIGIHTELLGPGMIDLIRTGVATGKAKTLHPRKHVFSVAYGTRDTFDFMDDNPSMESYSTEYVQDPAVIARNDKMVSVNSIIEVDLTGQCNAETIDGEQFSGTGGQLDFVRGAFGSKGGKSILAFYSTAKKGTISRVVPKLGHGAGVTTPRTDTHYLVTEYGSVNLKGKSTRERALSIIDIAHPNFRDDLLREADQMSLL